MDYYVKIVWFPGPHVLARVEPHDVETSVAALREQGVKDIRVHYPFISPGGRWRHDDCGRTTEARHRCITGDGVMQACVSAGCDTICNCGALVEAMTWERFESK